LQALQELPAEVKASRDEIRADRDDWRARHDRLALAPPIAAPGLVETPEAAAPDPRAPEPRRSCLRYWFGWRAA
jgi:hypothetical protein